MENTFIIKNLDCAACADKISQAVAARQDVNKADIDFISGKLVVDSKNGIDNKTIREILARVEPEASLAEEEDQDKDSSKLMIIRIIAGAVLFGAGFIFKQYEAVLFIASLVILGFDVMIEAIRKIVTGQWLDENFLMTIAAIGAAAIGQYEEGAAVMLLYQIGELFQDYAVDKSRRSVSALLNIRPDRATVSRDGQLLVVDPQTVAVGESIVIKPGEKVALDGVVTAGSSQLDTSSLTGESMPRDVAVNDEVLSGCVNLNGLLTVRVTKPFGQSTASKVIDLVENATSKKAKSENFITKFARIYTPVVVGCAVLLAVVPPLVIPQAVFSDWLYRALVFLVISCPCALVISVPLSYFGGIGGASKKGILVKGSNYLEALAHSKIVVFDKTGTLTKGNFEVEKIVPTTGSREQLLEIAAWAESYSSHPIAQSLQKAYGRPVDQSRLTDYQEIAGCGITVNRDGGQIAAGNYKLMQKLAVENVRMIDEGTVVYVAADGRYAGYIVIADQLKEDAQDTIEGLKKIGISQTVMLTGDAKAAADRIAGRLGTDQVKSQLLPADKVQAVEELLAAKKADDTLVFVGDGINDAPVLARADIGIAMGALGADAAIEAADVVIMDDQPSRVVTAIKIAQKTSRIVKENIVFALAVKVIILIMGALGHAGMWLAVFADVGVALLAILNAMRMLQVKKL